MTQLRQSPGQWGKCAWYPLDVSGLTQRPVMGIGQRQNGKLKETFQSREKGLFSHSGSCVCSEGDLWEGPEHWRCTRKLNHCSRYGPERFSGLLVRTWSHYASMCVISTQISNSEEPNGLTILSGLSLKPKLNASSRKLVVLNTE